MNPGRGELERFRMMVEVFTEGVSLWDEDGELIFGNPAFWRICGVDPEGGPVRLDAPGWIVLGESGAPLPHDRWPVVRALRESRVVAGEMLGLIRPDGSRVWVSVSAAPTPPDGDGRPQVVASIADITAERDARETMRAGHALLTSLIDGVPEVVFLRDLEGRYLAVNQAFSRWVGRPREELVGLRPADVLPGKWVTGADAALARMNAMGDTFVEEARDARTGRVWRVTRTPYRDADGRLAGMVGVATEITEFRSMEAELTSANTLLERRVAERTAELERAVAELEAFSYRVSHDLRAPLRAIDGFSRALADDLGPTAPDDLRRIGEAAAAMSSLVEGLLDPSTVGRRVVALDAAEIDLTRVAAEAAEGLAAEARARGVTMEVADLPTVTADARLLRQVFANLLGNAVKFSRPGGGRVGVRAYRRGRELVIAVDDDGVGFDPADAGGLFGAFERLPNARAVRGTGIGLAIVERIVSAHGGRVWATGSPGGGACFSFALPVEAGPG